jgi:hypothetical protein
MLHLIASEEAPVRPENVHHAFDAAVNALQAKGINIERTGVRHDG